MREQQGCTAAIGAGRTNVFFVVNFQAKSRRLHVLAQLLARALFECGLSECDTFRADGGLFAKEAAASDWLMRDMCGCEEPSGAYSRKKPPLLIG